MKINNFSCHKMHGKYNVKDTCQFIQLWPLSIKAMWKPIFQLPNVQYMLVASLGSHCNLAIE
jgi:hypothetical protein